MMAVAQREPPLGAYFFAGAFLVMRYIHSLTCAQAEPDYAVWLRRPLIAS